MAHGKRRDGKLEAGWRKTLAGQARSGVTAREFCRREGLAESAFHFWKRELARRDAEQAAAHHGGRGREGRPGRARPAPVAALVPVMIASAHAASIELSLPRGVSVRVSAGCDEAMLRKHLGASGTATLGLGVGDILRS